MYLESKIYFLISYGKKTDEMKQKMYTRSVFLICIYTYGTKTNQ